jgi:signal transduction histidine kinase
VPNLARPLRAKLRALRRRPVVVDVFLTALTAVPGLIALPWSSPGLTGSAARNIGAAAMLAVAGAAVFARRRWPVGAAAVGGVAFVVAVQAGSFDPNGSSVADALMTLGLLLWAVVLSFTLGRARPVRWPVVGLAFVVVSQQWHGLNPFPAVLAIGSYAVGWIMRSRQDLAAALDVRAVELASERQRYATEAVRYERARIARELHDVVAHCMSIVVVQASAGQRLHDLDPGASEQIFADIGELAQQAEADLAGLTRLLSRESQPAQALTPAALDQLVAHATAAGTVVEVTVAGELATIPLLVAAALHRVLQEGLTNAIKHAPGAPVTVTVQAGARTTSVDVGNEAAAPPAGVAVQGGGTMCSERTPSGGWLLSAVIPVGWVDHALPRPRALHDAEFLS